MILNQLQLHNIYAKHSYQEGPNFVITNIPICWVYRILMTFILLSQIVYILSSILLLTTV